MESNPAIGKRNNSMVEHMRAQLPPSSDFRGTSWLQSTPAADRVAELGSLDAQMNATADSYAVVAFSLPEQYFPDDDDVCAVAGSYVARELGIHLERYGHSIPEWVKGGCREDVWVYLESERDGVTYFYDILFFPRSGDTRSMAVRYGVRASFLRRIFRGGQHLRADDSIHEVLKSFGAQHENLELLTRREFDARY